MKLLRRKLVGLVLSGIVGSQFAFAEPVRVRVFNPQQSVQDNVLKKDRDLVEKAIAEAREFNFRSAVFRLRIVETDARSMTAEFAGRNLLAAVQLLLSKLDDTYISSYEKISLAEDYGAQALEYIDDLLGDSVLSLIAASTEVLRSVQLQNYGDALQQLQAMQRVLERYRYRDYDLQRASETLRAVCGRIEDHYLPLREKFQITQDYMQTFRESLLRSETYQSQRNRNDRPFDVGYRGVFLSSTSTLGCHDFGHTRLAIAQSNRKFTKIRLIARNSNVFVKQMVIEFRNGTRQVVDNFALSTQRLGRGRTMDEGRVIDLAGDQRFIREITFLAKAEGHANDGRIEIYGF